MSGHLAVLSTATKSVSDLFTLVDSIKPASKWGSLVFDVSGVFVGTKVALKLYEALPNFPTVRKIGEFLFAPEKYEVQSTTGKFVSLTGFIAIVYTIKPIIEKAVTVYSLAPFPVLISAFSMIAVTTRTAKINQRGDAIGVEVESYVRRTYDFFHANRANTEAQQTILDLRKEIQRLKENTHGVVQATGFLKEKAEETAQIVEEKILEPLDAKTDQINQYTQSIAQSAVIIQESVLIINENSQMQEAIPKLMEYSSKWRQHAESLAQENAELKEQNIRQEQRISELEQQSALLHSKV